MILQNRHNPFKPGFLKIYFDLKTDFPLIQLFFFFFFNSRVLFAELLLYNRKGNETLPFQNKPVILEFLLFCATEMDLKGSGVSQPCQGAFSRLQEVEGSSTRAAGSSASLFTWIAEVHARPSVRGVQGLSQSKAPI